MATRKQFSLIALMMLVVTVLLPATSVRGTVEAGSVLTPADARIRRGKWIEIILSQQRLIAWENGRAVMSSPISSGLARTPTRRGTFRIQRKYPAVRMRGPGYDLPRVPYTMFYSGGYAIHGAYWHNNFGRPMSHGCVNLPVSFARRLYAWAPKGTLVVIR
ncbi:MAG: L,D-transpeptidase [Anaerolineae bacterium]